MTVWTLTKGTRTLRCEIENHPLGQEVRLYEGDELRRSEVVRSQSEILTRPQDWKGAALAKSWLEVS